MTKKRKIVFDKKIVDFLKYMQSYNYEIAGYLDVDKKNKLTDLLIKNFGDIGDVELPPDDKEVEYHTHPTDGSNFISPPSPDDLSGFITAAIEEGRKFMIVLAREGMYIVTYSTTKLNYYDSLSYKEFEDIINIMESDLTGESSQYRKDEKQFRDNDDLSVYVKNYAEVAKKYGFKITYVKYSETFTLNLDDH